MTLARSTSTDVHARYLACIDGAKSVEVARAADHRSTAEWLEIR